MKKIVTILGCLICYFAGQSQTLAPVGTLFSPNAPTASYKVGFLKSDSAVIIAARDTNFIARYPGTLVFWAHAGVDTAVWVSTGSYTAVKWLKVVTLTAGTGFGTVTNFSFVNGSGFFGNVNNSTSTPTLSLSTTLTTGSIPFIGSGTSGTALSQKNSNLFYDSTNSRVGINTNSPQLALHVSTSEAGDVAYFRNSNINGPSAVSLLKYNATTFAGQTASFGYGNPSNPVYPGQFYITSSTFDAVSAAPPDIVIAHANYNGTTYPVWKIMKFDGTSSLVDIYDNSAVSKFQIARISGNVSFAGSLTTPGITDGTPLYSVGVTGTGLHVRFTPSASGSGTLQSVTPNANYGLTIQTNASTSALSFTINGSHPTPIDVVATGGLSGSSVTVTGTATANLFSGAGTNLTGTGASFTSGNATKLTTGRTIGITGDITYTSPAFDGSGNVTAAATLPNIIAGGIFGSATQTVTVNVNSKGQVIGITNVTAAASGTVTSITSITNAGVLVTGSGLTTAASLSYDFSNLTPSTLSVSSGFTSTATISTLGVTNSSTITVSGTVIATAFSGTITTSAQPNITSVGTLGQLTITNVLNAGSISGTLTTAAQPNITSVGTLGQLTITNVLNAGSISGTITTANQPNITNVGSLTKLSVTGNETVGGTLIVTGNITGTLATASQTNVTTLGTQTGITVTGMVNGSGGFSVTGLGKVTNFSVLNNQTVGNNLVVSGLGTTTTAMTITSGATITALSTTGVGLRLLDPSTNNFGAMYFGTSQLIRISGGSDITGLLFQHGSFTTLMSNTNGFLTAPKSIIGQDSIYVTGSNSRFIAKGDNGSSPRFQLANVNGNPHWNVATTLGASGQQGDFFISNAVAGTTIMTITAATGATTFLSSVTAASFITSSDTLKKDIVWRIPSKDGIDMIAFHWKKETGRDITPLHYGYAAQQVQKAKIPAVVEIEDTTMKSGKTLMVDYDQVFVYKLAQAELRHEADVKMILKRLKKAEDENVRLKKEIATIKKLKK